MVAKPYKPVWMRLPAGAHAFNPQQITSTFADFLSKLYAKPDPFPLDQAEEFFRELSLPAFSKDTRHILIANISEALQAIKSWKPSLAPMAFLAFIIKSLLSFWSHI